MSLVPENKVDHFIQKIRNAYQPYRNLGDEVLSEMVFATKPGRGACGTLGSSTPQLLKKKKNSTRRAKCSDLIE